MSISIATMGKFTQFPCGGSGGTVIVEREVEVGGGGSYGFEERKPQIIVRSVDDEEDNFNIRITKVTEI